MVIGVVFCTTVAHDVACFGFTRKTKTWNRLVRARKVRAPERMQTRARDPGPFRATENFSTAPPGARHFYMLSLSLSLSLSPEPRTFNLRVNLAHVDLLAAVLCALQGYARASFDCVHPDSLRMLAFIGRLRLIRASRRGIVLRTTPTLS